MGDSAFARDGSLTGDSGFGRRRTTGADLFDPVEGLLASDLQLGAERVTLSGSDCCSARAVAWSGWSCLGASGCSGTGDDSAAAADVEGLAAVFGGERVSC